MLAMVDLTRPWLLHLGCVAVAAAVAGWFLPWFSVAVLLSYALGSVGAFFLTNASYPGSVYWRECFWEPVFVGGLQLVGEDLMGFVFAWVLPLAISCTVIIVIRIFTPERRARPER